MRRPLAILLIATIFACPLICAAGNGGGGTASASCCGCCHRAGGANSSGEQSCPAKPTVPDSGHACQCICGGAVVEDAGTQDVSLDTGWSLPVAVAIPLVTHIQEAELRPFCSAPWPDVGMNPGRALRCLLCTYLC